jgi:drug/metabolite transporter (DMT)-like permease
VGQLGVSTVLYGKAIPHVRAIEAIMIPIMEPVLNPLWVWLLVGEVPSGWALVGGTMVVGAVTARGLTLVWHTPRADVRTPRAA